MWNAADKSTDELRKWEEALQKSLDGKWSIKACRGGVNWREHCSLCEVKDSLPIGLCEVCPIHDEFLEDGETEADCCREYGKWRHKGSTQVNAFAMRDKLISTSNMIRRELILRECKERAKKKQVFLGGSAGTVKKKHVALVKIVLDAGHQWSQERKLWERWVDGLYAGAALHYWVEGGELFADDLYLGRVERRPLVAGLELHAPKGWKPEPVEGCYIQEPAGVERTCKTCRQERPFHFACQPLGPDEQKQGCGPSNNFFKWLPITKETPKATTIKEDCLADAELARRGSDRHAASEARMTRYLLRALTPGDSIQGMVDSQDALKKELEERLGEVADG